MASWSPGARKSFNSGVTTTRLSRATAKKLENDIDFWAGTIGGRNRKTFDPQASQATFDVWAENRTVTEVECSY